MVKLVVSYEKEIRKLTSLVGRLSEVMDDDVLAESILGEIMELGYELGGFNPSYIRDYSQEPPEISKKLILLYLQEYLAAINAKYGDGDYTAAIEPRDEQERLLRLLSEVTTP